MIDLERFLLYQGELFASLLIGFAQAQSGIIEGYF